MDSIGYFIYIANEGLSINYMAFTILSCFDSLVCGKWTYWMHWMYAGPPAIDAATWCVCPTPFKSISFDFLELHLLRSMLAACISFGHSCPRSLGTSLSASAGTLDASPQQLILSDKRRHLNNMVYTS